MEGRDIAGRGGIRIERADLTLLLLFLLRLERLGLGGRLFISHELAVHGGLREIMIMSHVRPNR